MAGAGAPLTGEMHVRSPPWGLLTGPGNVRGPPWGLLIGQSNVRGPPWGLLIGQSPSGVPAENFLSCVPIRA